MAASTVVVICHYAIRYCLSYCEAYGIGKYCYFFLQFRSCMLCVIVVVYSPMDVYSHISLHTCGAHGSCACIAFIVIDAAAVVGGGGGGAVCGLGMFCFSSLRVAIRLKMKVL